MATSIDIGDAPITAMAWNKDNTLVAISQNNPSIEIYQVSGTTATLKWTLTEHTQTVSGLDWHPVTNQLVSCSHDRNAFVWTYIQETDTWKKDLVVLRLDRAATMVRWNHAGDRFVVTTGAGKIRVCKFMKDNNWWMAETISCDNHPTQVYAEYFPDDKHILVASTDRHCYYLCVNEDEAKMDKKKKKLDFVLSKFPSQGWVNACSISPSGKWIAYATQDSTVVFIKSDDIVSLSDAKEIPRINVQGLPLLSIQFLSETVAVGAGFECFPRIFALQGEEWKDLGSCDIPQLRAQATNTAATGMAARAAMFGQKVATKTELLHQNIIVSIRVRENDFTTCGNDGRIGIWPKKAIADHFKVTI